MTRRNVLKKGASFTPEAIENRLRAGGMRITATRRRILGALFEAKRPMSLPEIQESASSNGELPDYATVFRTLALLEKLHLAHKVNLQRSCSYYELHDPSKHYDHIVCTGCGKVVVLDVPCPLSEAERMIADRYKFAALTHSLEFFGRCAECVNRV